MWVLVERTKRNRRGAGRVLVEAGEAGTYDRTVYLTARTCADLASRDRPLPTPGRPEGLRDVVESSRAGDAGLCVCAGPRDALAFIPPFPVERDEDLAGCEPGAALALMARRPTVLVVLIRLGRYSVGILEGERVLVSKSGTRYVKRPHRAGGSSQGRFERSRKRLEREFYDAVCRAANDLLRRPDAPGRVDFVMFGGAPGTVRGFGERCDLASRLGIEPSSRLLSVERPGHRAMQAIGAEVFASTLLTFRREPGGEPRGDRHS